jgi:DNA-binding NarL/FixJ family response regulator
MSVIRVLVADDHVLVRAGFRSLIQSLDGVEVVAETGDGREALALIRQHRPHVALLDIAMPGLNGIEVTSQVAGEPSTKVIILSMHATDEYVRRALSAGASGYLLKDAGVSELEVAIRAVTRGGTYLSPAVSKRVVEGYVHPTPGASELERLTPRQREILQLVAEGCSTKEIAQKLKIGVRTVEAHRAELMERVDIHDIAGLVRYAIRMGLVTPDR